MGFVWFENQKKLFYPQKSSHKEKMYEKSGLKSSRCKEPFNYLTRLFLFIRILTKIKKFATNHEDTQL